MARTTADILAEMAPERRAKIEARAAALTEHVNTLAQVRKIAGKTQAQIADQLGKKQPSIQKMERQADFYVSTLRRFVEAAGGSVEIRINLPDKPPVVLDEFSDLRA